MSLPKVASILITVVASIIASAPGSAKADAARGLALSQGWCSQCHAIRRGEASANPDAPAFASIAVEPSVTEYSLRTFLRTSHPTMPNFVIKADDIDDLADYILALKPVK
jgi:cytochrome c